MRLSKKLLAKVVVFTLICAVLTVALGVKLANSRLFADTYVMKAEFDNAAGVMRGDAVKIAGVDVGRVESSEIRGGRALITFNIDKAVRLPQDSTAAIRWRNVTGQRFLYVYPGTADDDYDEEQVIPASQTEDVADIGEFLNRLGPILQAINPEQANAFLDAMNTALTNNEANVRALLDAGAVLSSDLAEKDQEISSLLDNSDEIMAAFASQDRNIESILDDVEDVSGVLARRTDDINTLVTNFADVQEQLDELLVSSRSNIDSSIGSLHSITDLLARNKKNLKRTLESVPAGVSNYFQTSSWGEFFNVRLIKLMVQDNQGNDLAVVSEADNQHGDSGGGTGDGDGGNGDGDGGGSEPPARENVGSILRYVLTGDGS
ncbi:MAG: MlaD family protein [Actinomycetota bacterium]